jgi:hypothetical protein
MIHVNNRKEVVCYLCISQCAGLCWRTVLMAMTARYFGSLASPTPRCSKLDRLVALMAVRHGRRVCNSSHSADTCQCQPYAWFDILMSLRMQRLPGAGPLAGVARRCQLPHLGIPDTDDGIFAGERLLAI